MMRSHSENVLVTAIGNLYPALIALVTGPILAHALGVFGRGQVAAGQAPLALISTVATFGLPEAVTFAVASTPALARLAVRRAVVLLMATGVLGMAVVFLASQWLSGGDPATRTMIVVASLALVPTLGLGAVRGVAAATQHWRRIALERIGSSTMRLVVILALLWAGALTPLAATIVLAAMPVAGALAYLGLPALRRSDHVEEAARETVSIAALSGYGLRLWIGSVSGIVLSRIDQVLLTGLSSAYVLGIYVVAVTVSELPLMINSAVRDVIFASDSGSPEDERLLVSARVSFLVCLLGGIGIGGTMWWWLPLLFGASFSESVGVAAVLLVAVVLGTPGSIAGAGLSARGRPGLRSMGMLAAGAMNVVLLIVLVPTLGAWGAALATLAGTLLASNVNIVALHRLGGLPWQDFYVLRRADALVLWRVARRILRKGPR